MTPANPSAPRIPFWVWGALPVLLGTWLRLRGIGGPEPFVDEGANILTALDSRVRVAFEPLAQGRPALVWLFKPAGWVPSHALEVARLMAAGAGIATMAALGFILHALAGRTAAFCGMVIWAVLPLAVFHERLALQDPFITALLTGAVALFAAGSVKSEQRRGWVWFVGAGGLFGTAFLLKISAALALPWLAIMYVAVRNHVSRPLLDRCLAQIALGALVPVVSLGSSVFSLGSKLDRYGALPVTGDVAFFPDWLERIKIWLGYYAGYGGWPLLLLALLSLIFAFQLRHRLALTCAAIWLVALLVTGLFYHNTFARYTLSDHVPLILFIALACGRACATAGTPRIAAIALLSLSLAGAGDSCWQIGTDPTQAPIPPKEIAQYFTGAWSGRGVNDINQYLRTYADKHHVTCLVLTHQFLRPGCYGLMLAELGDSRIGVVPHSIYEAEKLAAVKPSLKQMAAGANVAFFILYEGSLYPPHPWLDSPGSPTRRVYEVPRGGSESFTLYQFEP